MTDHARQAAERVIPKWDTFGCADYLEKIIQEAIDSATAELRIALTESLKLQSHYAKLLNMHDGGKRITFASVDEWLKRLKDCKAERNDG